MRFEKIIAKLVVFDPSDTIIGKNGNKLTDNWNIISLYLGCGKCLCVD